MANHSPLSALQSLQEAARQSPERLMPRWLEMAFSVAFRASEFATSCDVLKAHAMDASVTVEPAFTAPLMQHLINLMCVDSVPPALAANDNKPTGE
jgi:hypothetical protein